MGGICGWRVTRAGAAPRVMRQRSSCQPDPTFVRSSPHLSTSGRDGTGRLTPVLPSPCQTSHLRLRADQHQSCPSYLHLRLSAGVVPCCGCGVPSCGVCFRLRSCGLMCNCCSSEHCVIPRNITATMSSTDSALVLPRQTKTHHLRRGHRHRRRHGRQLGHQRRPARIEVTSIGRYQHLMDGLQLVARDDDV